MDIGKLINIKTPDDNKDVFNREKHTRYTEEIRLFSCIQQGDINKLIEEFKGLNSLVVTGRMSDDDIVQCRYLVVSSITLATRYAIQGGLNENIAYNFSDEVILSVDSIDSKEEIINYLAGKIIELTRLVGKSKASPMQSLHVKKCIYYINDNIDDRITVKALADYCNMSADYLSQVFKKEMGENLSTYITRKKLEKAKELIAGGEKIKDICIKLSFNSPSHFITAFKRCYNITPSEYAKLVK